MNALLEEFSPRTLLDDLLAEQQRLTAVERFAQKHERDALPAQARYYRELIPLTAPQPGEQYAFAVDLDRCTGCKACVSACHSLNGLDEDEIWRNVGLLHGGDACAPYQQTVTTACHHCLDPACLEGCPVRAYEKDAATGIVRHLDDQCIGCQYCVLKCPYDVPKYSAKRGIVRKCDMCHGRLGAGEAPACVQACPTHAISIRVVKKSALRASLAPGDSLLPGAFDSHYTKPATQYTSRRAMPANTRPGDDAVLRLEPAHWPLIGMLVLTQIAAGMFLALAAGFTWLTPAAQAPLALSAFAFLNAGLGVSVLHLGRPLGAWRAFLGLRTSWMSREILVFGLFAGLAALLSLAVSAPWLGAQASSLLSAGAGRMPAGPAGWKPVLLLAAATGAVGMLGVYCSAMIYVDTRRAFWNRTLTFTKFFGTTVLLGAAGAGAVLAWIAALKTASVIGSAFVFIGIAAGVRAALFFCEAAGLIRAVREPGHPQHRSALIMWRLRRKFVIAQPPLFLAATALGVATMFLPAFSAAICATLSFLLTAGARVIERYFFFTAVVAPRMPGGLGE